MRIQVPGEGWGKMTWGLSLLLESKSCFLQVADGGVPPFGGRLVVCLLGMPHHADDQPGELGLMKTSQTEGSGQRPEGINIYRSLLRNPATPQISACVISFRFCNNPLRKEKDLMIRK